MTYPTILGGGSGTRVWPPGRAALSEAQRDLGFVRLAPEPCAKVRLPFGGVWHQVHCINRHASMFNTALVYLPTKYLGTNRRAASGMEKLKRREVSLTKTQLGRLAFGWMAE